MSPPASDARPLLRALLWLWLGAWIGAMALFGAMTRVAFAVVENPEVAGHLVRRLLDPVLTLSAVSGIAIAMLGAALRRGRLSIVVPLLLSMTCLVNQFGVSRAVAEIHLSDPGLAPGLAARFASLHRLSVGLFVAAGLGAVALAGLHARIEARATRGVSPSRAMTA